LLWSVALAVSFPSLVGAQNLNSGALSTDMNSGSISGRIWDDAGSPIGWALVQISLPGEKAVLRGTETNDLGQFRLVSVAPGSYALRVVRLGFHPLFRQVEVDPGERVSLDLTMETAPLEMEGVSVEAVRSRGRVRFEEEAGVTIRELTRDQIKAVPGVVESDPLRAVDVLPGVVTTSDFSSAFNVRGGSADQNLILLDGLPLFNPTHLGGFFSVFNGDMIDRAEFRSGGFPVRFGGRVSSVLDVRSEPGNGTFHADAGVSLLATRLALGGGLPAAVRRGFGLKNAKWRFSGRRSHLDQVLKPVVEFPYHLTDLQGVFEGWTTGGDRIAITAYLGRDHLDLGRLDVQEFPFRIDWDWGNDLLGGSYTHPTGDGGRVALKGGFSRFSAGLGFVDFDDSDIQSLIQQWNVEGDWEVRPSDALTITLGGGVQDLRYTNQLSLGGTEFAGGLGDGRDLFGFMQAEWQPSQHWLLELGIRGDRWSPEPGLPAAVLSPRFSIKRFSMDRRWALKASAGRYAQFLQSIRDEELPVGLDIWVLAGTQIPHVVSDQLQLGVEGYPREGWKVSLEGFLRDFDGVSTTNLANNPNDPTDDYLAGVGRSYGADILISKSDGPTTGWLTVSWLRATRSFPDFLSGLDPAPVITFPPTFHRRLDLDLVIRQRLARGLEAGIRWGLGTGLPYTMPLGGYSYLYPRLLEGEGLEYREGSGSDIPMGLVLGQRNQARYPARHRLDISLRWEIQNGWGLITPYLNILNVYNHENVLYYFYEFDKDPAVRSGISMFPFLPSFGIEVSF
jgi:hypothetical protein